MKPVDAATIKRVRAQLVGDPDLAGRSLARRLSQQADSWFESLASGLPDGWAVMATGGYARGVLAPGSDIDVMLVHPAKVSDAAVRGVAETLWYPFWDAGLKLSPAAHTTKSVLALASDDLDTATSVLDVRCLAGSPDIVAAVQQGAREQWRKRPFVWLERLHESSSSRWERFGPVASLLEPDLKDGRGGLRDNDLVRWALRLERDDVAAALEGPADDLVAPAEFLLAVRCELHRATGRPANTLLLQDQDRVAEAMGFADADALMRNIAGAAHAIEWASERFWTRVSRLIRSGSRQARSSAATVIAPGVVDLDGEANPAPDADLDEQSYVFRFAAAAAHAGIPMSGRALRLLASRGSAPGEEWSENTRRAFVSLLGAGEWLVHTTEALERYGLFSRFLPEWRHVRSLPQRNALHTFTVDHHLLQTVANANEFVRDVARPDLLLVGSLLHDIGKGYPGDHTEVGVDLATAIMQRMGFTADDLHIVQRLIEHHLLLPETATRRDLSDPRTAANVAAAVNDLTTLELLAALTESDSRATGPAAWSAWKASLLRQLVESVTEVIEHGEVRPSSVTVSPALERIGSLALAEQAVQVEHVESGDVELVRIAAVDQPGLFARITAVLALHGCDVVGAAAVTRSDGIAIDEFRIARVAGVEPTWEKVQHDLRAVLSGDADADARLEQRLKSLTRRKRAISPVPARLEVLVSNDASDSTTVVEVRAPDAPVVLYRVANALSHAGVNIRSAVVATLGHEVVDVFYVTLPGSASGRLADDEFEGLRDAIRAALA